MPVTVTPVRLSQLKGVFTRDRNPLQSSDFSFSRFLVPWLCNYAGWAVFMDCDMLMRGDIAKLWALRHPRYAVQVVKHQYQPKDSTKFLGAVQTSYDKKNWSSVMLFNCSACKALTPEFVNTATGLELHQFKWLASDEMIGELPSIWNHLVGEYEKTSGAALVHYTVGGPYFTEYRDCDFGDEWFAEREGLSIVHQRRKS
jgi:lipopolysaccharide biosynthesis glycosyltransferase